MRSVDWVTLDFIGTYRLWRLYFEQSQPLMKGSAFHY